MTTEPPAPVPVKVGLYARFSVEGEGGKVKVSIESQEAMMSEICTKRGWTVMRLYKDEGLSGALPPAQLVDNYDAMQKEAADLELAGKVEEAREAWAKLDRIPMRPGLTELLDDARAGLFNMVMVIEGARLARDAEIFVRVTGLLKKWGLQYCTALRPDRNPNDPSDKFLDTIDAGANAYFRELTALKTQLAREELQRQGKWVTRPKTGFYIVHAKEGEPITAEEGKLKPDAWGEKAIAAIKGNPRITARLFCLSLGVDPKNQAEYRRLWSILTNCKEYLGLQNFKRKYDPRNGGRDRA